MRVVVVLSIVLMLSVFVSASWYSDIFGSKTKLSPETNSVSDINSGLVDYYKFDEVSGNLRTTLLDSSGNSKVGAIYGEVLREPGKFGSALNFAGNTNSYAKIPGLHPDSQIYSISLWLKPEQVGKRQLFVSYGGSSAQNTACNQYMTMNEDGQFYYSHGDSSAHVQSNFGSTKAVNGAWIHLTSTYDGATLKTYVNGVLAKSVASTVPYSIVGDTYFGGTCGYPWYGSIDEVRIYNRVLSDDEVKKIYDEVPIIPPSVACTDSDGGIKYYTKGTATGYENGSIVTSTDGCRYDNKTLAEVYCSDNVYLKVQQYTCPSGVCSDGACIPSTNTSSDCTDSDGSVEQKEITEGTSKIINDLSVTLIEANENTVENSIDAKIQIKDYGTIVLSTNHVFETTIQVGDDLYLVSLVSGTDTSSTLSVMNLKIYTKGTTTFGSLSAADYCSSDTLLSENICSSGTYKMTSLQINCPSGVCSDGACIPSTNTSSVCTDSDGGNNPYVAGNVIGGTICDKGCGPNTGVSDKCVSDKENYSSNRLNEYFCSDDGNYVNWYQYVCVDGCSIKGECLKTGKTQDLCSGLIDTVKYPVAEFESNGVKYKLSWNDYYPNQIYYANGQEYNTNEYMASYYTPSQPVAEGQKYTSTYVQYDVMVFDDKSVDLVKYLDDWMKNQIYCKSDRIAQQDVYICNYRVFDSSINSKTSKNREIIWANGNVLVQMYTDTYESLTNEEINQLSIQRAEDFINTLGGTKYPYAYGDYYVDYPAIGLVENSLGMCNSKVDFSNETCLSSWNCKTEPAICPPHGFQTRICVNSCPDKQSGERRVMTDSVSCNPGICAGCLVPKWFGNKDLSGENKCIPYGFRFENQIDLGNGVINTDSRETLSVDEADRENDGINLTITQDGKAILYLENFDGKNITYTFVKGDKVDISSLYSSKENFIEAILYVNDVIYNSEAYSKSYIDFNIHISYLGNTIQKVNAYCEIDGQIGVQKVKDYDGSWAKCQNNYECESNVCSSGECVDVKGAITQAKGLRAFFVKILCAISNPLSSEQRDSCVAEGLGIGGSTTPTSSGGSSGGSSSP